MKKSLKTKWIKALRSGEYMQAQGVLFNDDNGGHCCLGVLAEVGKFYKRDFNWGEKGCLSTGTLAKCGITVDQQEQLIEKNDDESRSFMSISNWIEKNL